MQNLASFEVLVKKVKETFRLGNQRINQEAFKTCWQAGKYIHEHILHHGERANYGDSAIIKLSQRVEVSDATLERALRVYREFPKIPSALRELGLTHFYSLTTIPDKKLRSEFGKRAVEGEWSTRELAAKIKKELRYDSKISNGKKKPQIAGTALDLLKPKLGILYTYKMIESKPAQANPGRLKVDLGFSVHRIDFRMNGKLQAEDIIESVKSKSGIYTVMKSKRSEEALYTYKAWVMRVPDADTQFVEIDLGFDGTTEQYLRLRGIDAPELNTPEGRKAKEFVEKCLKPAPYILLTSSRSDKFDRYLSDIFIPLKGNTAVRPSLPEALVLYEGEEYLYLNNELLIRKLAQRY